MHSPAHIQKASDSGSSRVRKRRVIQADLEVGQPGDKYEQEADAVAQRVMMQPSMEEEEAVQMETAGEEEEMAQMESAGEEEEMVQMAAVDEEEALQMQSEEEEAVQMQMASTEEEEGALQMQAEEEEEVVQQSPAPVLQRDGSGDRKASAGLASRINSAKGGGDSMESGIQREMEHKIGADFSGVNIHTGSSSVQMSRELGAKAFTVGNDIHFSRGQYDPHTSKGKRLLAHELTHTVQQGAVQRKIQRVDENGNRENNGDNGQEIVPSNEFEDEEVGSIDTTEKKVTIPKIPVPEFKAEFGPNSRFEIPPGGFTRNNNHLPKWESDAMKGEGFKNRFEEYAESQNAPELYFNDGRIFYLTLKNNSGSEDGAGVIFGNIETIKQRTSRPYWDEDGNYHTHDVDHKRELQLGGEEENTENMWMLDSSANRSSGSLIKYRKKDKVEGLLTRARPHLLEPPESYETVKENYKIIVEHGVEGDPDIEVAGNPDQNYELRDIQDGKQLEGLNFLTESEVEEAGLRGNPNELVLFTSRTGGLPIRIPWDEDAKSNNEKDNVQKPIGRRGGAIVIINTVRYNSVSGEDNFGGNGEILCTAFPGSEGLIKETTNLAYEIEPMSGISYGGYITRSSIEAATDRALEFRELSPILLTEVELDPETGLTGRGIISPTIPLISDAEIELIIDEDGARLRKVFSKNDFNFPSPFEINETTLEVFAGTRGLGIEGQVDFGIEQLGEGHVGAAASTEGGFELEGVFNFDSELFEPASIEVEYKDEVWTIGGEIGIPEGKVRGVKNATIEASYSEGNFEANGEADLDIPGIERGTMEVNYGEEGFSIGGAFDLSSDIPGIRSGSVEATVSKKRGEEEYSVTATGKASPEIPGINTELSVEYDNGIITIGGTADYSRGMLSGSVRVGATNRPIGDDSKPEGEPDNTMRVYGGGSLTLQLTPWLEATAGVEFLENGEMEVKGRIGLPSTVDVFPRKEINKDIFRAPTIEIPLFAIPLGPRSIGLVAQIGGGLTFKAGFGPGQLRELYAEVTYNPDREEETVLSGRGVFAIPADAGLTLSADASLGVSAGIASLTGGIELAGTLGLEGEALASVDVNWSPQTGIALDAEGRVTVNPKFNFDVNAFARATLGIGWFSVSETWRHRLAGFEWGPDIQFGIVFPVHYKEGEPFDLSFDDIEVIYPELDIPNMAKGLARDIKDDLF